jgi:hypothetical protein
MDLGAEKKAENQNVDPEHTENVRTMYKEVCESLRTVTDFRGKLLALLPVISGVGIYGLVPKEKLQEQVARPYLTAIGILGVLVTIGLFLYELRGIDHCRNLIKVGRCLEEEMGFTDGQFIGEDKYYRPGGRWWVKPIHNFKGPPGAAWIIYPSVGIAWLFVAVLGLCPRLLSCAHK